MKNGTKEKHLSDFYQSVLLKSVGFQLLRLERQNPRFVVFVFADPKETANKVIEEYWNRRIQVDARTLIENINELKTRLYSKI